MEPENIFYNQPDDCVEGSPLIDNILREGIRKSTESRREHGFHASSAGKCYREMIAINCIGFKPQVSEGSQRNFALGHLIHAEIEKFFHDELKNTKNLLVIGKKRVLWQPFGEEGINIVGEPDLILIDIVDDPYIHVIDIKSSSTFSFEWMKRKSQMWGVNQSYYLGNALQVATYMGSIQQMFKDSIMQGVPIRGALLYIEKNNLEHRFIDIGSEPKIEGAKMYWKAVQYWVNRFNRAEEIPPALPRESWQCGYCSLFQSTAKSTATRKKHCLEMCQHTDLFELTKMANQSREEGESDD